MLKMPILFLTKSILEKQQHKTHFSLMKGEEMETNAFQLNLLAEIWPLSQQRTNLINLQSATKFTTQSHSSTNPYGQCNRRQHHIASSYLMKAEEMEV